MEANNKFENGLVGAAAALIDETGAVPVDDVMAHLHSLGYDIDRDDLIDLVVDEAHAWWLSDAFVRPRFILAGRAFAHRLTADEVEGAYLELGTDLQILQLDDSPAFDTPQGALEEKFVARSARLAGAASWFAKHEAGDLVALRWSRAGVVEIVEAPSVDNGSRDVEGIRRAYDECKSATGMSTLLDIAATACLNDATALQSAPPLGELCQRAGLEVVGDEVAPSGFDWERLWQKRHEEYVDELAANYDLDRAEAEHLATLAVNSLGLRSPGGETPIDADRCRDALRDAAATAAYLERRTRDGKEMAGALRTFAGAVLALPGSSPAGAHLLLAAAAELDGDAVEHARHIELTYAIDSAFHAGDEDAAWIAADQGLARRAAGLLERVAEANDPRLRVLDIFSEPGPMSVARNDRCPCGSGAKYKACCSATNGWPLAERAVWLYEKAMWYADRPAQHDFIERMLEEALSDDIEDELYRPGLEVLRADRVVRDLALFHAGLIQQFAVHRAPMLPSDEVKLASSWCGARTRLLRVTAAPSARDLVVVDVVTGESITVAAPHRDDTLSPGGYVLAAILSDGQTPALLGWSALAETAVDKARAAIVDDSSVALLRVVLEPRWRAAAERFEHLSDELEDRFEWLFAEVLDSDDFDDLSDEFDHEQLICDLVRRAHPEMVDAIERGAEIVRVAGGHDVSPQLHLALHEVVANQILRDAPPEAWQTAVRLVGLGYEQHEVLHMLASTISTYLYDMLNDQRSYDVDGHIEALRALPETWELARNADTPHRPSRDQRDRRHHRH